MQLLRSYSRHFSPPLTPSVTFGLLSGNINALVLSSDIQIHNAGLSRGVNPHAILPKLPQG